MMIISKFRLNRKKKIYALLKDLKSFIAKTTSNRNTINYLYYLSKFSNIPQKNLQNELKIILFKNFENRNGKFSSIFYLRYIFFYSIKFLLISFYIIFFSKKISTKHYCDLIVDDLDKDNTPIRFYGLKKYFNIIFVSNNNYLKIKKNYIFSKFRGCSKNIFFIKNPFIILKIFFLTIYYSVYSRNNLFPFLIEIFKTISRSETIFEEIKSNFLLQERHYNSSDLKNFIYKRKGGKYSCVTQKNILQINGVGMYVYSDIFFSLGRKTAKYLKKYGGETKKILPIGSLAMELNYYKRKDKNDLKKYDLLVFASDHNKMFHSGYDNYYSEYLKHFEWIKKFSIENPKLKVGIKLKHVVKDQTVLNKFNDVDNVKFLVDRKYLSDSYFYAHQAKSICTWSSTLAFEFLGQGRVVYFCDPNFKNISYLPNDTYIKKFKINTYNKFKKKIYEQIKNKKSRFFKNKKLQEDFCLNSKDVSKNINYFLKKLN